MLFPRKAQFIAFLLSLSFVIGTSAQTSKDKPAIPAQSPEAAKQKPDYSQEAVVIEQLKTTYRF